jgi:Holliday junction resolvasome RuvABC endonuclease subunit
MATPPLLRIMGLDLSLNATGVCLPDGRVMTIKCKAAWGDNRLCVIRDTVRRFLPKTDLVVIEDKVHTSYAAATLGMVQGVVRTELMDQGVPYAMVPVKTIKKYATGNGNADKADMLAAAKRRAGLIFKDDNQCDSWWARQCGLDHYDAGVEYYDPDPALSDLLDVVDWPDMTPVRVG